MSFSGGGPMSGLLPLRPRVGPSLVTSWISVPCRRSAIATLVYHGSYHVTPGVGGAANILASWSAAAAQTSTPFRWDHAESLRRARAEAAAGARRVMRARFLRHLGSSRLGRPVLDERAGYRANRHPGRLAIEPLGSCRGCPRTESNPRRRIPCRQIGRRRTSLRP